jgi:hypothetical protein
MSATRDVKPVAPGDPAFPSRTHTAAPTHRAPAPQAHAYEALLAWATGEGAAQQAFHVLWMFLLLFALARRLLMRRAAATPAAATDRPHAS